MTDLSKIQFVAMGLVHDANLFTKEDLSHLSHYSIEVYPTDIGNEKALVAYVKVYFKDWSYLAHAFSTSAADAMPAEVRFDFDQDDERKLTGKVEGGFFFDDVALMRQLDYIRGW